MKKRFVVSINDSEDEQERKFIDFLRENGLSWWHWLANTWLVVDAKGKFSASDFRDTVKEVFKNEHVLVIEMREDGDTWSGFGPNTENRNMFRWLKTNWKG